MNEPEKPETMICYAGVYANVSDAKSDFDVIKAAHKESWIGTYDAALFEKNTEGKVKVLDTDATQRGKGARIGAITGAVLALIFPPSILVSAGVGAAAGAALGNLTKGFSKGDIKDVAENLKPGEAGILLVANATVDVGAQKLMKKARKVATQRIDALKAELANA